MKRILSITILSLSVFISGGADSKNFLTSTEHDPIFIGEASEISIGKNTDRGLRAQNYVDGVGQELAKRCKRKKLKFKFTVLDDKLVNAFAAPGGFIYITTGIMKMLKNEAELAGVLGHEIGHVVHRHSLKAIQRRMAVQFAIQLAAYKLILSASQAGAQLLLLKNSRENELQADSEGVNIMNKAGYNPNAMAGVQKMLLSRSGGKNPPAIISTHPPSQERIDVILEKIKKFKKVSTEYREAEYKKIIGMAE
jgi:predicted Zn-dependent protease